MSKKQLNVTGIQNELEDSAFFTGPRLAERNRAEATPPPPEPPISATPPVHTMPSSVETVEPPISRSFDRTTERTKVRHSFDVYSDQLLALRQLALTREAATGTRVLLGDLVQEAIDMLFGRGSEEK